MQILSKRIEKWGIDVDAEFEDTQGVSHTVTLRFNSEEQIASELQTRINRQIANITADSNDGVL